MAKWKSASISKSSPHPAGPVDPGSVVSAERTKIIKGYRSPGRFRYSTEIASPQGWKASFMSF